MSYCISDQSFLKIPIANVCQEESYLEINTHIHIKYITSRVTWMYSHSRIVGRTSTSFSVGRTTSGVGRYSELMHGVSMQRV